MTNLYHFDFGPLWRAQIWAFGHLVSDCGDLRWTLVALLSRGIATAGSSLVRNIVGRALQGARFASSFTPADTTVAAGGR